MLLGKLTELIRLVVSLLLLLHLEVLFILMEILGSSVGVVMELLFIKLPHRLVV